MSGSHIFLTGATGFVGRHLVARLLEDGFSLTLAIRDRRTCPQRWWSDPRLTILTTGPIENASGLEKLVSGHRSVVHAAGLAHLAPGKGTEAETAFTRANAAATAHLARAARNAGIANFIHISSLAAVTPNAAGAVVDEATSGWRPDTAYGRSKLEAEQALAAERGGMVAISLRPPLIIGADAPGNWRALQRLAASGVPLPFRSVDNRRSLISVQALAARVSELCNREWPIETAGNYCVAEDMPASLRDIVTELRAGMQMGPRLLPCPPSLIRMVFGAIGGGRRADGLLGNLVVDDTRYLQTFGFDGSTEDLRASIRLSGAGFIRQRAASPDGSRS